MHIPCQSEGEQKASRVTGDIRQVSDWFRVDHRHSAQNPFFGHLLNKSRMELRVAPATGGYQLHRLAAICRAEALLVAARRLCFAIDLVEHIVARVLEFLIKNAGFACRFERGRAQKFNCGAEHGIRFRASRALRLYRIFPVSELIRITGLLVTVAAILSAVAFPRGLQAAVFMVATALLAFGAADVIQETFAMRARRRRSDAIIVGPKAQTWRAIARTLAGLTCLILSFVGFMIWASVTTEM